MNRYDVLTKIGQGSFGTVFRAKSRDTGQGDVAVKRFKHRVDSWASTLQLSEIKALRAIKGHPNLSVIRENDGTVFVVMQMAGENLHQALLKVDHVDEATCADIMRGLFQGLAALHRLNYVHRDIKPENILIARDNSSSTGLLVTIGDLGSACLQSNVLHECYVTTRFYRAPEMVLDMTYGPAVDVWAAGCVGFEALCGRPLFPANNEVDLLNKFAAVLGSPPADFPQYVASGRSRRSLAATTESESQSPIKLVAKFLPRRPFRLAFANTKHSNPSCACVTFFQELILWQAIDRPSSHQVLVTSSFLAGSLSSG